MRPSQISGYRFSSAGERDRLSQIGASLAQSRHHAWLIELAVLFALLMLVEAALPGPGRLAEMAPHPFWLPVLLLSLQYGIVPGATAAAVATLLFLLDGAVSRPRLEDVYDSLVRVYREPVLWFGAALFFGGIRTRHISELDEARNRLAEQEEEARAIAGLFGALKTHAETLERRFVTEDRSVGAWLASMEALRTAPPDALGSAFAVAADVLLGPAEYAFVLRPGHRGLMESSLNAMAAQRPATTIGGALERALWDERRSLSFQRDEDAAVLGSAAMFAVPIVTHNQVLGAVLVQGMDVDRIGDWTIPGLEAMAQVLGAALGDHAIVLSFARGNGRDRAMAVGEGNAGDRRTASQSAAAGRHAS